MKLYKEARQYKSLGDLDALQGVSALVTTSKGILHLDGDELNSIERDHSFFGLTRDKHGTYWCTQNKSSILYRFRLIDGEFEGWETMADLRPGSNFSHRGIHQIDFIDDELFVLDTYNNRCLILMPMPSSLEDDSINEIKVVRVIYPRGRHVPVASYTKNGIHGHFNSIYAIGDRVYILAHNNTAKTSRQSQVYVFEKHTMRLQHKILKVGSSVHNLVVDTSTTMYMCDSDHSAVVALSDEATRVLWEDTVHRTFVRGMAVNDDVMLVGGSFRNQHKENSDGYLFLIDKSNFKTLCTIKMEEAGQIHDIRFTGLDYGYSNTWRRHGY
jgi:hypothetical protein